MGKRALDLGLISVLHRWTQLIVPAVLDVGQE